MSDSSGPMPAVAAPILLGWEPARAASAADDVCPCGGLERSLREAEAMEGAYPRHLSGGRLAALVAHELNTPLQAIFNLLFLAERDEGAQGDYIRQVRAEIDRLSLFVGKLRDFAQPDGMTGPICCNQLVERVRTLSEPMFARSQLTLVCDLEPGLPVLHGAAGALAQALFDLLTMLVDGGAGTGVWIRTRAIQTAGGPAVLLRLTDHEPPRDGAPVEVALGAPLSIAWSPELGISRAVVERHGGSLAVQRGERGETRVAILLPAGR